METLSKEEFIALATGEAASCVSIFIPVHRSGVEVNEMQDAIRLKDKLLEAEKTLAENGTDQDTIDRILKGGFSLFDQRDFWNVQLEGLAVFMSDRFFKHLKLPFPVKEELLIDSSFNITPLLPLMDNQQFYLLVLGRDDSTLYCGDAFDLTEVKVAGLPQKLNVELGEGGHRPVFRGTDAGKQADEEEKNAGESDDSIYLMNGLKKADQALMEEEASSTEKLPLLLAGTGYLAENFKKISHYGNIVEEILAGNFVQEDKSSLHQQAKEKLASYFNKNTMEALHTFYENSATELTSSIPEEVIPATYYKKVSDLFVQKDEHLWGEFIETANLLKIHEQPLKGDTCLINKAVVKTLQNGGAVHVMEKDKMPVDSKIAAFMRY